MSGSTDSNWIFDPSSIHNDDAKPYSGDPTEKYNYLAEGMKSGGSDSIQENFSKLKNPKNMEIRVPTRDKHDIIHRNQMSMSPKLGSEADRYLFQAKRAYISSMSGIVSREDNMNPLLFSINENLSAKRRKPKSKIEEEIIEELFTNKRDPNRYSNVSNLSAVRSKRPKKTRNRKRNAAFKGINPNQVAAEFERLKTNQRERDDMQSRMIEDSCQITKKGKEDIENMVKIHKTKTSMIYSEINSVDTEDELADTVKPLDFKDSDSQGEVLEKRKLTFGFKLPPEGGEGWKEQVLENRQLQAEIHRGIQEHFGPNAKMNRSEVIQQAPKKKKKKTGSMRIIKTEKTKKKKPPKLSKKNQKNPTKQINKRSKKNLPTKKKMAKKKKTNLSSKKNLKKVISKYGIPLLEKETGNHKKSVSSNELQMSKSRLKSRASKAYLGKKKKAQGLMNSTLETSINLVGKGKLIFAH